MLDVAGIKLSQNSNSTTQSTSHITEQEAIAQGYTVVKTAQEFLDAVKNSSVSKIILMNDLSFAGINESELELSLIGKELNGNGYFITDVTKTYSSEENSAVTGGGFFSSVNNSSIKNIGFKNINIINNSNNGSWGIIAGETYFAEFENIYIENSQIKAANTGYSGSYGALIGRANGETTVNNVMVYGSQVGENVTSSSAYIGGLIGEINNNEGVTVNNTSIVNTTIYTSQGLAGGLFGYVSTPVTITDSYFAGNFKPVSTTTPKLGGIAGGTAAIGMITFNNAAYDKSQSPSAVYNYNGFTADGLNAVSGKDNIYSYVKSNYNGYEDTTSGIAIQTELSALFGSKLSGDIGVITKPEQTPEQPSTPSSGEITIESENGGNFDILAGLNGASILTGGVSGLKEDMVIAGQAGSYTIDQNGKNAFTLAIDADDTVGDVINKINASGMYKAYLDNDGKLVIAAASAQSTSHVPSNNGVVTGVGNTVNIGSVNRLTEAQAIAQGYTIIKTADEFINILTDNQYDYSKKYILMNDIDFGNKILKIILLQTWVLN